MKTPNTLKEIYHVSKEEEIVKVNRKKYFDLYTNPNKLQTQKMYKLDVKLLRILIKV